MHPKRRTTNAYRPHRSWANAQTPTALSATVLAAAPFWTTRTVLVSRWRSPAVTVAALAERRRRGRRKRRTAAAPPSATKVPQPGMRCHADPNPSRRSARLTKPSPLLRSSRRRRGSRPAARPCSGKPLCRHTPASPCPSSCWGSGPWQRRNGARPPARTSATPQPARPNCQPPGLLAPCAHSAPGCQQRAKSRRRNSRQLSRHAMAVAPPLDARQPPRRPQLRGRGRLSRTRMS
mmetsp:Transcript_86334/g.252648  ORF Transcript_86334/g.252648 Transcript_86334/m.252648 type:complete len:235 (-) Transcript_86334:616-1320(-)